MGFHQGTRVWPEKKEKKEKNLKCDEDFEVDREDTLTEKFFTTKGVEKRGGAIGTSRSMTARNWVETGRLCESFIF